MPFIVIPIAYAKKEPARQISLPSILRSQLSAKVNPEDDGADENDMVTVAKEKNISAYTIYRVCNNEIKLNLILMRFNILINIKGVAMTMRPIK